MRTITSCPLIFEAGRAESQPILETFACAYASAMTATSSSATTNKIDKTPTFLITHTVCECITRTVVVKSEITTKGIRRVGRPDSACD
jgi:hypothetical protein